MELKTGSSESTLDDKGRVSIPVRFREQFKGELFITRGMERCVWIITPAAWENLKKNLSDPEVFAPESRRFYKDSIIDLKEEGKLDTAGRIAIPSALRSYANLTKGCLVVSSGDRLTIWDFGEFNDYIKTKGEVATAALDKANIDIFSAR
jgi:MraZ protein